MSFAHLVAFLIVFKCEVEISWVLSGVFHAVAGSLGHNWESELAVKEFLVRSIGGGVPTEKKRGRAVPSQTRSFDSTMGYPGEDVAEQTI